MCNEENEGILIHHKQHDVCFITGTEDLGHHHSWMSKNCQLTFPLSASSPNPWTWQLPFPATQSSFSWRDSTSFACGLQRLPGTPQSVWKAKRWRRRVVDRASWWCWVKGGPHLCTIQPHPLPGCDWFHWLNSVCVGREEWEKETTHFQRSRGRGA